MQARKEECDLISAGMWPLGLPWRGAGTRPRPQSPGNLRGPGDPRTLGLGQTPGSVLDPPPAPSPRPQRRLRSRWLWLQDGSSRQVGEEKGRGPGTQKDRRVSRDPRGRGFWAQGRKRDRVAAGGGHRACGGGQRKPWSLSSRLRPHVLPSPLPSHSSSKLLPSPLPRPTIPGFPTWTALPSPDA